MLETHQKFRMMDLGKKNNFFIEVNWEPENEKINQCKVLKVTFPNQDSAFIERKHLLELVFAIGKPEHQRKLIPQTIKRVRWYETVVGVKATKDIAKGETINFPIKLSLPDIHEEVIGSLGKRLLNKGLSKLKLKK